MIARCQVAWRLEDVASVDVHSLPDVSGLLVEAPVALAYMGPGAGLAAIGALLAAVGVVIFMVVGFVWYPVQRLRAASRRRRDRGAPATESTEETVDDAKLQARFSPPDRFLHHMAFRTIPVQKALADLEDRLYAQRLADVHIEQPVFIASLPRAGTTLLLETLCSSGAFVAHTYRTMPFLFMPLFWNAISRRFRLAETPESRVERAHGDGLTIGYDSAEAFEEALWRAFHPDQYLPDRVLPWSEDFASHEFETFLKSHMRKLIALDLSERETRSDLPAGSEAKRGALRYISKNNGNLSRLPEIGRLFPDATILVPVRNPLAQANSLLRTHTRFLEIHAQESFTRRYMEDIGHFDFGANLRPIDFDHWLDAAQPESPDRVNYWLAYWCAAFGHVLANLGDNVVLVDYDGLCTRPELHLERIAGKVALAEPTALAASAARLHASTTHDLAAPDVDATLFEKALALHQQLLAHCGIGDDDSSGAPKRGGVR